MIYERDACWLSEDLCNIIIKGTTENRKDREPPERHRHKSLPRETTYPTTGFSVRARR